MTEVDVQGLSEQINGLHLENRTEEAVIEVPTTNVRSSAQAEDNTPHSEQRDGRPLKELSPYQEEVDKLRRELKACQSQKDKLREDLARKQTEVDAAEETIRRLVRWKTNEDIQFHEVKVSELSFEIRFEFVRAFYIKPKYSGGVTVAYMEGMQGEPYFAKNGKNDDTAQEFISCVEYEEKANNLFNNFLGSGVKRTWLQHAEPKLMALYVKQFLSQNGLDLWDLQDQQEATSAEESHEPDTIRIFVSRPPCETCSYLRGKVNDKTHKYGFKFTLENVSC